MKKIIAVLIMVELTLFYAGFFCAAKAENTLSQPNNNLITLTGRLKLEKHGKQDWLILQGKNAQTYLLKGKTTDALKNILLKWGDKNLVTLCGTQSGKYNINCKRSSRYEINKKGEHVLKADTECFRYHFLEVSEIISSKESDDPMPPALRDNEEETRIKLNKSETLPQLVVGEITGKISGLNVSVKNPVKTIEITNTDKAHPLKKISLQIEPETRVIKNVGTQNPIAMGPYALKIGQNVTVMYSRDEIKTSALSITITKDN